MKAASIIITSYNYGRFLRETIDSALAQSTDDVDIVVVDDGSKDNSPEVIRSYGDRIVSIMKENGGQASAFNAGLSAARGDVICFLDSDDLLLSDALARAVPQFKDPGVVKVNWPCWIIDAEGRNTGATLPEKRDRVPEGDLKEIVIRDGPFYDWHVTPPTSGNAWSRNFVEKVFPMPENRYRVCADEYLLTLAPIYGKIAKISEPLSCYRSHGQNHGWQHPFTDGKIDDDLQRFEESARILREHLAKLGINADEECWKKTNFNYVWMSRLKLAKQDLMRLTPAGSTIILVDEYDWGDTVLSGRSFASPIASNGQYLSHPSSSTDAIERIESLHNKGAEAIAFWWTAFWWFDKYAGLHSYLQSHYRCLLDDQHLVVFDLPVT